jgi:hypothetical protein
VEASGNQRIGATAVDKKLEAMAVPVSDVDRAKDLYQSPCTSLPVPRSRGATYDIDGGQQLIPTSRE